MRTKTLLLSAAVGAASLVAANAQVFSQNSVGYINKDVVAGFNLISNPLVPAGGGGDLNSLLPDALDDETVFVWNGAGYTQSIYVTGPGWLPNTPIGAGEGFFYNSSTAKTITFVGEVRQTGQNLESVTINPGFNLVSSQVPQEATLSALAVPGNDDDTVLLWDDVAQSFVQGGIYVTGPGWLPTDQTVGVGEAFFLNATAANTWDRSFSVND